MSTLIFHPSVAPFVQQAARALHEAGRLDRFVTTVHDDPASGRQRLLCALARLAGRDLGSQFRRRAVTELPAGKIVAFPWGELLRLAAGSVDRDGRLTDLVWEWSEKRFDRRVARLLDGPIDAVYGYEHSSLATFQRARARGCRMIYDVPAPDAQEVRRLLDVELDKFAELRTAYHRHTAAREERRLARRRAEWAAADLVIAASQFTRASYARAGLDAAKVAVVPYGAPPPAPRDVALAAGSAANATPAIFLWAGIFSVRKGAHYLLDAWRSGGFGRHARLRVFGAIALPGRLLQPLPDGVELRGSIPRAELMDHYRAADALVFPTLCDGFGMVASEAWSQGLPVITTDRAGAADLLRPGENGLRVRAGDAAALAEALRWCLDHRAALRAMREPALATAARWQWSDYRTALVAALGAC